MIRQYQNSGDIYSKYQCQERKSSASSTASTSSSASNQSQNTKFTQMSCQVLANAFQKNWHESYPDDSGYDESLTNLSWLHNVNPIKINEQLSFAPYNGYPKEHVNPQMYSQRNVPVYQTQSQHWNQIPSPTQVSPPPQDSFNQYNQPDYKNNPNLKPPFSYAILISWAMKELRKPKITLSDIYNWIIQNFAYYRHADSSWQNSIRHNLSLGKCFEKVPRRKDEPGKGGFWRINPTHARSLDISLSKIKYNPSLHKISHNKPEHQYVAPRLLSTQMSCSSDTIYPSQSTSITVKRSRKSPLTVTQEDWESQDIYNPESTLSFDDISNFNNNHSFELSPFDNSSSDSNNYGASNDQDLSLTNFHDSGLENILNSPMFLDKEDLNDHDDLRIFSSNSDFSDLLFTPKDDLRDLDCLLGIF